MASPDKKTEMPTSAFVYPLELPNRSTLPDKRIEVSSNKFGPATQSAQGAEDVRAVEQCSRLKSKRSAATRARGNARAITYYGSDSNQN